MYVITAVECDEITGEETGARTTLKVDKAGQVRELNVTANGTGLSGFPQWDLVAVAALLMQDQSTPGILASPAPPLPSEAITGAEPTLAVPTPAPRKRAAKTAAPTKRTRAPKPEATEAAPPTEGTKRNYRRMPPAEEVAGVYRQAGTVKSVADAFGVPTHTAQGWMRRLRAQGHITDHDGGNSTEE